MLQSHIKHSKDELSQIDVLIVGSGNAGLCAAIVAAEHGRRVCVIEKAPYEQRGGNSSLTMNFRFPHETVDQLLHLIDIADQNEPMNDYIGSTYEPYSEDIFRNDLARVSQGKSDPRLIDVLVKEAASSIQWLRQHGHKWQYKDKSSIMSGSVPIRIKGSGCMLQERSFKIAEELGVQFLYETAFVDFTLKDDQLKDVTLNTNGEKYIIKPKSMILACGGFQANKKLRRRFFGEDWENISLRGVPFNTGDWLEPALQNNISLAGDFEHCHATPQNVDLEDFILPGQNEESQNNSRYMFSFGVTVNQEGLRFIDENQSLPNFLYAKFGREIIKQTNKIAFQVFNERVASFLPRGYFTAGNLFRFDDLESLTCALQIDYDNLKSTLKDYDSGLVLHPERTIDQRLKDAGPFEQGPFYVSPVRAGLTFTYGGIKISPNTHVIQSSGIPVSNLFACGEVVGGIHYDNYAGGTGLMAGTVFGRIAGQNSALLT